jgi:hypothetical protein
VRKLRAYGRITRTTREVFELRNGMLVLVSKIVKPAKKASEHGK